MKRLVYLAVVLALTLAGFSLLYSGLSVTNFINEKLADQRIYFPDSVVLQAENRPELVKYANRVVDSGVEASAYARYAEARALAVGEGKSYSQLQQKYDALEDKNSVEAMELMEQKDEVFQLETLRSTLLNAYAWARVGTMAVVAGGALLFVAALGAIDYTMGLLSFRKPRKNSRKK